MSKIRWFVLPFSFLLLFGLAPSTTPESTAQESKVTPGRRIVAPRFEVDVLVDGYPLREFDLRGHTYVEALRGEEYEIRLRNRTSDCVAVALYVDGLNTIDSSRTAPAEASKWVIEANQTITISGWQMNSDHARRFYFTNERDSYAAKLGVRGTNGLIWASFYRERRRPIPITPPRPLPHPIYRDEAQSSSAEAPATGAAKSRSRRDDAATGIGRSVRHDVRYVDLDLESRPAAEVTIRYDFGRSISESNPPCRVPCKRGN